jgi:protein-disulfide isomerase
MREFPDRQQGKKALRKSRLAICAGRQEKYLEMHDWLYSNSEFTREELQAFTGQLDLDREEFKSCLRDPELANQLRANVREAEESAIKNPPGFLLGLTDQDDPETVMVTRYLEGPPQFTDLQTAIDELLEQAGASN